MGQSRRKSIARPHCAHNRQHHHGGRNVAFYPKKTNKLWLWRAYDPDGGGTLCWELGGRDDKTAKRFLDAIGMEGRHFITDDWEGYHRLIPAAQLTTGKDKTFPIEQDNSNIRHYLARFRRRTKVVSKSKAMVELSLRLHHHLRDPKNYAATAAVALSIYS